MSLLDGWDCATELTEVVCVYATRLDNDIERWIGIVFFMGIRKTRVFLENNREMPGDSE